MPQATPILAPPEPRRVGGRSVVVGASGLVGHALLRVGGDSGERMVGTAHRRGGEGLLPFDARRDRLQEVVPDLGPGDCVYLLGAHVDPTWISRNPQEARALNVEATIRVGEEVFRRGAKLVFLSTELVFDGVRGGYDEGFVPGPTTEYGRQKVEVEAWLGSTRGEWCLVRTGALVGWRPGENCPVLKTYRSLLEPGARMAADNLFSLTDVEDLARGLLRLAGPEATGIYHLAAAPPVSRTELADWIIADSRYGARMAYEAVPFDAIPYSEPRPRRSWITSTRAERELGAAFASPRATVRAKVALIDPWYQEGGLP